MPKQRTRANGEGTIFKYRNKYRASITTPEGKRITRSFDIQQEASVWITAQVNSINENKFIEPSKITLANWLIEYILEYAKQRLRQRSYERLISLQKHFASLGDIPLFKS